MAPVLLGLRPAFFGRSRWLASGRQVRAGRQNHGGRRVECIRLWPQAGVLQVENAAGIPLVLCRQEAGNRARSASPRSEGSNRFEAERQGEGKAQTHDRAASPDPSYEWSSTIPFFVRAMVLADKTLFITGPPDVVDEEEAFRRVGDPEVDAKLAEQDAALNGAQGSLLWAVSAENGDKLAERKLDCLPVFDSLIATKGRLYMATTDGEIVCFADGD